MRLGTAAFGCAAAHCCCRTMPLFSHRGDDQAIKTILVGYAPFWLQLHRSAAVSCRTSATHGD